MFFHSPKVFLKLLALAIFLFLAMPSVSFAQAPSSTSWWNDAVFYEVFVRSFKDNNGDGKGDLKGLIEKLDYLNDGDPSTHNDLGVTGIWLMPIQQSPSYHGYDVTDYRTVEQDYGSNQDFKDFIDAAHDRGIKVIIDYVMNHTSSQHPWFQQSTDPLSARRDWYVWQNPKPAVTGPWGQTVWYPNNASNYYAIFWSEMPDLNYNTPAVKTEMFDVARFWLEDMNVDGFRLDAVKYIIETGTSLEDTPETISFWKDFRASYKTVKSDAFAVGEAWTTTDKVKPYVENDGLDYCFEFDLAAAIVNTASTGTTTGLKTKIDEVMTSYPFLQFGTFLTNHDMNRVMDQLGKNNAKAKLAAELLLTLPGVPYIYYGEEIGMTGSGVDENKRTPLQWNSSPQAGFTSGGTPWRPVNADYTVKNVETQQYDTTSLWNKYRKLITVRNKEVALRRGGYKAVTASSSSVFAFLRQDLDENIVVVSNTGASALTNVQISLDQGGIAQGNYTLVDLLGGTQLPIVIDATGSFTNLTISQMPGRSTMIYKLLDPLETTTSVTFQVDMNAMITAGDFIPATETVDIVASFNHFGVDSISKLKDPDGDGIYATTISGRNIGSKIDYKYRINGANNGREEFSNSTFVREYFVPEEKDTITDLYQKQVVFTTGIVKSSPHNISVYPVPSSDEIFIEYSLDFSGMVHYEISDLVGVEKISSSFVSASKIGQYSLSCETLPSGVYLLNVEYNGTTETFRIIVQK